MKSRALIPERLDSPEVDPATMAHSLSQVSDVNRWLGGDRGLRWGIRPLLPGRQSLRILDVGSGDGTCLGRLVSGIARRGVQVRAVAFDLHTTACRIAQARLFSQSGVTVVQGSGSHLPFRSDSFDVVTSTLTLHHFDDEGARCLLREMGRVASHRVIVSDLHRSRLNYIGARALAATLWRSNPYTRHDGPVSVLRSFVPGELESLARDANLHSVRVARHLPFRLTLVGEPGQA